MHDSSPFQSTPLIRGETACGFKSNDISKFQSTPLTRGETVRRFVYRRLIPISIHSPHTRGDRWPNGKSSKLIAFQSTPLIRGETRLAIRHISILLYFNPLPSYEGRPGCCTVRREKNKISIHSPHTRGDRGKMNMNLSTFISIHSPHTRGDAGVASVPPITKHFNPLPSHEGRPHRRL